MKFLVTVQITAYTYWSIQVLSDEEETAEDAVASVQQKFNQAAALGHIRSGVFKATGAVPL